MFISLCEIDTYPREHTRKYTNLILFILDAIYSRYSAHMFHITWKSYRRYFTRISPICSIGSSKKKYTTSSHDQTKYDSTKIDPKERYLYIWSHEEIYDTYNQSHPDNNTRLFGMTSHIRVSKWCIFFGKQEKWSKKKIAYHGIYAILFKHRKGLIIRIYHILL